MRKFDLFTFAAGTSFGGGVVRALVGNYWSALFLIISGILFLSMSRR